MAQTDFIQALFTGLASTTQDSFELAGYRQELQKFYSPKIARDKSRHVFSTSLFASVEDLFKKNKNTVLSFEMINGHLLQLPRGKNSVEACAKKACEYFSKLKPENTNWFTSLFNDLPSQIQEDFFKRDPQNSNLKLQQWLDIQRLSRLLKSSYVKTIKRL